MTTAIKAVAMDVDGVLTDGSVWFDEDGRQLKRISFADIMGVSRGRRAGLRFALISGESGPVLDHIAAKLGITTVYAGCKDKGTAVREFATQCELELEEVCYIGDDVNDLSAFAICGLAVAPAGAQPAAREQAAMVTTQPGGAGAVREVIEYLMPSLPAQ